MATIIETDINEIRSKYESAPYGQKRKVIEKYASKLGVGIETIYRKMRHVSHRIDFSRSKYFDREFVKRALDD